MKTRFFEVEKQPIYMKDKRIIPNKSVTIRTDTKVPLGIVGFQYVIVDDNKLYEHFSTIASKLKMKYELKKRVELKGGSRTIMEIEFPDIKISVAKGDDLKLRLYLINTYDCTSTAKMSLGLYRLVCSNGMIVGTKDVSVGYRHIGNVNEKLVEIFSEYLKTKVDAGKTFIIDLQKTKFKNEMEMLSMIEKQNFLGKRYTEKVIEALDKEKLAEALSAWKMYNAYTYVIAHEIKANADNKLNRLKKLNKLTLTWR